MLTNVHTILPAADLGRARTFYHDKLGLDPALEIPGLLVYGSTSTPSFEVYETSNAGTAQNTQMCWLTDDIDADMTELRGRGVTFEDYDFPGLKTENGVATMDEGKSAWFRDSEGNFLCITQVTFAA
jgi:catechol 2,3-dioxygenase-like lactoylglutathione lyase family enzyme